MFHSFFLIALLFASYITKSRKLVYSNFTGHLLRKNDFSVSKMLKEERRGEGRKEGLFTMYVLSGNRISIIIKIR